MAQPPMQYGDPSLPQRFWDKVYPCPISGCWLWMAAVDKKGYGFVWYNKGKRWAHKVTTPHFKQTAHHKCYVNCCVNPAHMVDVSRELNSSFGHHDQQYDKYDPNEVPF